MVRAQTRTDDDARGSHLSIPGIRIFRMNDLHRCVNNNANRFHWCVRADSKPPVSDVCLRSMDSMPVASTTIPSTRRKRRSNGDICYRCLCFSFSFFFFLERSVIVNLLVWIVVRGYVRWLSQLGNCSSFELRNLSKSYFKEVMFVEIKMIRIIIESCSV